MSEEEIEMTVFPLSKKQKFSTAFTRKITNPKNIPVTFGTNKSDIASWRNSQDPDPENNWWGATHEYITEKQATNFLPYGVATTRDIYGPQHFFKPLTNLRTYDKIAILEEDIKKLQEEAEEIKETDHELYNLYINTFIPNAQFELKRLNDKSSRKNRTLENLERLNLKREREGGKRTKRKIKKGKTKKVNRKRSKKTTRRR